MTKVSPAFSMADTIRIAIETSELFREMNKIGFIIETEISQEDCGGVSLVLHIHEGEKHELPRVPNRSNIS